jgi:hypothetical protein
VLESLLISAAFISAESSRESSKKSEPARMRRDEEDEVVSESGLSSSTRSELLSCSSSSCGDASRYEEGVRLSSNSHMPEHSLSTHTSLIVQLCDAKLLLAQRVLDVVELLAQLLDLWQRRSVVSIDKMRDRRITSSHTISSS